MQGDQNREVVITGDSTHFVQGTTQVSFENPGITVTSTTVNSATKVTVLITISPTAAVGKGDVTVTTGTEMVVCTDAFEVLEKVESCLSVVPSSGVQSERNKEIVIEGELTHFLQGVTQVSFENPGVVVTSTVVNSSTRITVTVDIAYNAPPETGDVDVATGSERITCYNAFTVFERTYQISEIRESNPTSASFTVSWITDAEGNGEVHYSTDPSFSTYQTAYDDRGTEYVGITHHVSIGDLEPETTYYYEVKSGGTIDDNSGLYYSFATMKIPVEPPPICPVYGWVYLEDEVTPAEGTIVYLEITHELEPSYWISGLVSPIGVWVLNLGNLYSTITNDALPYAEGDPLSLEFQGGNGRVNSAEFTVPDICPLYCGTVILEHLISELMGFDTGFNLIAFPFIVMTDSSYNEITYTACDLIGAVSGSTQAFSWDANAQRWLTALDIGGGSCIGDDFSIEPGKGYFVKCSAETTSTFYGKELAYPLPLTFEPGYNLIAVSYPPEYYTSCSLVGAIAGATKTFSWDATYQRWLSSLVIEGGLCVGDSFPIERERGYFVHSLIHIDRWVPGVGGVCSVDADCNDNNGCTNESCVDNVCLYSNNTTTCDDGLFCTENDVCSGGVCSGGAARDCSAFGNQCNNASCDEGLNQCVSQPRPNGTACEDGLYCTMADQCTGGVCVAGPARDCSASGGQCTDGECDEVTDQCIGQPLADGTGCEDGLYCTEADQCAGGVCVAGSARDCSASADQCNDGVCNETADQCGAQPRADGTVCEDGLYCTVSDQCVGGACTSGSARDCSSAGNQCNDGVCSETTDQCVAQPRADGTVCSDGLSCTQVDECQGGVCLGSNDPCVDNGSYCDGVEYCTEGAGDYVCNSTGNPCDLLTCDELTDECTGSEVSLIVVDSYGYAGTIDISLANELDAVSEVQVDMCDVDRRPWLHINTTSCGTTPRSSDFNCAVSDLGSGCVRVDLTSSVSGVIDPGAGAVAVLSYTIDAGAPVTDYADLRPQNYNVLDTTIPSPVSLSVAPDAGTVRAIECSVDGDCNDANACTDDTCVSSVCQHTNNTSSCEDGLFCTENDVCAGGVCGGVARDCSASGDQCNDGVCDEGTDQCVAQPVTDGTSCEDGLFCTEADQCTGGICGGAARDCSASGDQCNNGVCDEGADQCVAQPVTDGTSCEDGLFCTEADQCTGGVCTSGSARDCSASGDQCNDGVCDEGTDQCVAQPVTNGTACEDGQFCTVSDQCTGGVCTAGSARDCSASGDQCNDGVCSEATDQCIAQPKTDGTGCDDGLFCTVTDVCTGGICGGPARDCSASGDQCNDGVCSEATDQCLAQPKTDGTLCEDGQYCTVSDQCAGGVCTSGGARDCSASADQCNNGVCDEDANQCVAQPKTDGTGCDDGLFCTVTDVCTGGICGGPARDCSASGNQCNDGVCSEATDQCVAQPKTDGTLCEDGLYCTVSDQCVSGVCNSGSARDCSASGDQCNDGVCNETADQCVAQPKTDGTLCEDGLYCTVSDQCVGGVCNSGSARDCSASGDQCNDGVCSETTDQCVAQPKTDGTACDDSLYCTQLDECQGGLCQGSNDPCVDNTSYCDGVERCQEDISSYLCTSTGDPCDLLTCDELNDECTGSNVSLIIVDAYGYSGTIDIALANEFDSVSEVHLDVCNIDARSWLHISATDCSTTARSSDFNCAISDLGNGCVKVDLTSSTSGLIDPNTGAVAVLNYTIDPNAPLTDYADLEPRTISILDDTLPTPVSLSVTPVPGRVRAVE